MRQLKPDSHYNLIILELPRVPLYISGESTLNEHIYAFVYNLLIAVSSLFMHFF